jgi:hypothetical protein
MTTKRAFVRFSAALLMCGILLGCGGMKSALAGDLLYTRYNIHVQDQTRRNGEHLYRASYANYTDPGSGHIVIPADSKIKIVKATRKAFEFLVPAKGIKVLFEYNARRMGMSVNAYLQKITSSTPVSLEGFSKVDRRGITQGKALVGMSRKGVMTALGYPATHRTPSLDASTYIYWTNRFGTLAVEFGKDGKVEKVKG